MQVLHRVSGRVAGIPYSKNTVDLNTGDVTQMVDAATGLIKAIGGVALVGAVVLGGIGIIAAILYALMSGLRSTSQTPAAPVTPPSPPLPLGCSPIWIETPESRFSGIILNSNFSFLTHEGNQLSPELTKISNLVSGTDNNFIQLVDGSSYRGFLPINKTLDVATIGGKQSVKVWSGWSGRKNVSFYPSTINDVNALKNNLQQALTQNGAAITQLIGPGILQTYFNVPKIGP